MDPWNGSGTTTYAATSLGFDSFAIDLNPVMVVVARARLLDPSEADSIEPLAEDVLNRVKHDHQRCDENDPLQIWFDRSAAGVLRCIERTIRSQLIGSMTLGPNGVNLSRISGLASTFYVALFSVARELAAPFRASNPTWIRRPKSTEEKVSIERQSILDLFRSKLAEMSAILAAHADSEALLGRHRGFAQLQLGDTTSYSRTGRHADLVLTSPPYCTRIDYTAATRIEIAILSEIFSEPIDELSRKMIGSTRVPVARLRKSRFLGVRCLDFLERVRKHPSKASSGYYYKTHLDYFHKMRRSLTLLSASLNRDGGAVLVVQDSYYKDVHNDLPEIISEIGELSGLRLERREDFRMKHTMAGINPRARSHGRDLGAVEAVLCFSKKIEKQESKI